MVPSFSRSRVKITPSKKKGSFSLGYFNSMTTSGGVPTGNWSPAIINPQFFNYQAPYQEAKYCLDDLHQGPPFREGGPFRALRLVYTQPYFGLFGKGVYVRNDGLQRYVGGFGPPANSYFGGTDISNVNTYFVPNGSLFPSMGSWGLKAWQMCRPKLEKASAMVFLAELRDLPGMLRTTSEGFHNAWKDYGGGYTNLRNALSLGKSFQPKAVADQFLNQQFGWAPFLGDLQRFNSTFDRAPFLLSQLTEQNGKWVKRRVTLKEDEVVAKINSGFGVALDPGTLGTAETGPNGYFSTRPSWEVVEVVQTKITAVGSFQYYRPEFDKSLSDYNSAISAIDRQLTLYGLRVNPSNLYKAYPWTWAIDWVSDIGAHVSYLNDIWSDSIAAKYFYLMQHQVTSRKFRQILPFSSGTVVLEFERIIDSKQREEGASPYDFSLSWDQLTPRQLLIAAALFITRRRPAGG